jgi:uncharacterized membrane protein YagU involved in acid resistance
MELLRIVITINIYLVVFIFLKFVIRKEWKNFPVWQHLLGFITLLLIGFILYPITRIKGKW